MGNKTKAKVVKKKKSFPWGKIFYYFKSLFNNGVCLEIATTLKWFWSIIVFVFALLIAVIQPTVSASQVQGSTVAIRTQGDPFYLGLNDYLTYTEKNDDKAITFNSSTNQLEGTYPVEKYSKYYINGSTTEEVIKPFYSFVRNGGHVLDIYVYNGIDMDIATYINGIAYSNTDYGDLLETMPDKAASKEETKYVRNSSFIVFTKDQFYCYLYANGQVVSQMAQGTYKYVLEAFSELNKTNYTFAEVLKTGITSEMNIEQRQDQVIANFGTYLDKAYVDIKTTQVWVTFGIYAGLDGGIMLIMSLVVFLMTRGKNNPNRSTKFLQCFSIANWFSITPALLTLMLGFIFPSFGPMLFLITYSFRIMFLSMKYLRPAY